jgi:hypothetical protein
MQEPPRIAKYKRESKTENSKIKAENKEPKQQQNSRGCYFSIHKRGSAHHS